MINAMRRLSVDEKKIELVLFGIDVERFSPGPADEEIKDRWGARGRSVVISLRSLEPVYDIPTLLGAVQPVVEEFPEALFVICGAGSAANALKGQAQHLGVERNVLFTGRYANPELPRMLRSAEVYVSTSLSDAGIAASTAEAMACGVPVIVSNTGENENWITDGENGLLFAARDSAALANGLRRLLRDAELRKRMGAAGRRSISDRNSYSREMEKMDEHYRQLAATSQVDRH